MHSSSSSTKDENLDFVYLNNPPNGDSTTSSSNSFYNYSAESPSFHHHHHQYGAEHQAALSSNAFSHFANYQQPHFQTGMVVGKPDHYSPVPQNVFSGNTYDPAAINKGYSAARTFSGNDLLADNSSGRNLRRLNSDVSSAFEFGTYNPFQGSPLEITNLTRLDSRSNSLISEEQAAPIQQQVVQQVQNEPYYETAELQLEDLPSETGASGSSSKRSYKDVLTISQNRSESPNNNASSSPAETVAHTTVTNNSRSSKVDNEQTRKETYKDKLLSSSSSSNNKIASSQPASPSVSSPAQPTKQQTQSTSLNNHRSQINTNPKKPLKINNNLAAGKV